MLIISKIDDSVSIWSKWSDHTVFRGFYLRTFARQRMLQSSVSWLTVTRRHPLNGGTSLVLADITSTRVAHDACVDSDWRLSRSSMKRRPSNRSTGSRSRRWWIWLCNREPVEEDKLGKWLKLKIKSVRYHEYYRPCTNNGRWLRSSWLRLRLHVGGSAIRILE